MILTVADADSVHVSRIDQSNFKRVWFLLDVLKEQLAYCSF